MRKMIGCFIEEILVFFSLLALEVLHIAIQPFSGGFPPFCKDSFAMDCFIKAMVFYLAFWAFYIFVLCENSPEVRSGKRKLIGAIVIQAAVICIRGIASLQSTAVFCLLCETVLPIQWFSVLLLFHKCDNGCGSHRSAIIGLLILTAFWLPLSLYCDYTFLAKIRVLLQSYYETSSAVKTITRNATFLYGVKYSVSECAFGTVFWFLSEKKNGVHRHRITKRSAQLLLSCLFTLSIYFTCLYIAPNGCIVEASHIKHDSFKRRGLNFSTQITEVYRVNTDNATNEKVYCKTSCRVRYNTKKLIKFSADGYFPAIQSTHAGDLTSFFDNAILMSYNEKEIGVFCNHLVVIADEENAKFIPIESLEDQSENENLVALCRKIVEEDLFYAFPHAVNYLMQWNSEFVIPYIRDYIKMDNVLAEKIERYGIRPEYVQAESLRLLYASEADSS